MPTMTDKPLEGLPVNGVFPLTLWSAFKATLGKGKGAKEDVIGLKCTRLSLFLLVRIALLYSPYSLPLHYQDRFGPGTHTRSKRGADSRYIQTRKHHAKHPRSTRHG